MEKKHILICGERGVGKSTLVEKLVKHLNVPVYGFFTRMFEVNDSGYCPLHMFSPTDTQRRRTAENHVADCNGAKPLVNTAVFDNLGLELLKKRHGFLVMDELGVMENGSPAFCEAVLRHLDGEDPVIATVKAKKSDFLDKVRSHPKAELYYITPENRDSLYEHLSAVINSWNAE